MSLFSSNVDTWETPQKLFDLLDGEFCFDLDPCASHETAKCSRYFTEADDGLNQVWWGTVFMNPPYGRTIARWVEKAHRESQRGVTVVCLIPARTDTAYWHDHVMHANEIRFIRGRLHFGGGHEKDGHNAPFPSAVVVFRPQRSRPTLISTLERP